MRLGAGVGRWDVGRVGGGGGGGMRWVVGEKMRKREVWGGRWEMEAGSNVWCGGERWEVGVGWRWWEVAR